MIKLIIFLFLTACSPSVYYIDRHSHMEEEAAGEWPDFEKKLRKASLGPQKLKEDKKRQYGLLKAD